MKFVGGTVYTYVEVEMFPFHRMTSSKPRTKYIRNEFSPVFNDEVCIKILKEEVDDQKMYLHVCDYNQISTRDLIGSYKMNLDDVSFKSKGKETVYEGDLRWIDSVSHALFYTVVVVRCLLTLANNVAWRLETRLLRVGGAANRRTIIFWGGGRGWAFFWGVEFFLIF